MPHIDELNTLINDIIRASTYEIQLEAGKKLIDFTIRKDVPERLKNLAENIAMLMVQKEGKELHLEIMEHDLLKTSEDLHIAQHDPLTGLPNRGILYSTLNSLFDRPVEPDTCTALFLIDLDQFKPVNDTYGHDAGDRLLRQAAARIQTSAAPSGFASRLGGDEFVVLFTGLRTREEALLAAREILNRLKEPYPLMETTAHVSASLGISFRNQSIRSARTLLKCADLAMYQAKRSGGDQVAVFREVGD